MQNNKLNCPFCDCGAIYEITETEDIVEKVPALFCNGCKMIFKVENDSPYLNDDMTFEYLKEKLHKQFNTRKPMERILEQLESLCKYNSEQAEIYHNVEKADAHTREMKDLYIERTNCFGVAIRTVKGGVDNG